MIKQSLANALAVLLFVSIVVPATFFIAPQRSSAQQYGSCLGGLIGAGVGALAGNALGAVTSVPVNSVVVNGTTFGTWGSALGTCINEFVIQPLIKAAIRALLQKITATVIGWINGGNGTGQPSYVQNLPGHLQNVSDTQALAFLKQIGLNSISPFAAAITSSLSTNYLQNTSSAGFFAANADTFVNTAGSAANATAFLAGDWSKGGAAAWFALTTQPQNNPYTLYQATQSQLGSLVNSAQSTRLNELNWGQGYLAWCGPATAGGAGTVGTAPGNTCTNTDGSPGTVQTPASLITHYADSYIVDSGMQQYVNMDDLDAAFSAIINALVGQVLGGVGGLFGAGNTTAAGGRSLISQLQTYAASTTTTGSANQIVQTQILQTAQTNVNAYESSWGVIRTSATYVSTALTNLANSCPAQATAAQAAITAVVTPILAQAATADANTAAMLAMIQQVQNELNSGDPAYTTDLQTLSNMAPSTNDVSSAQQATTATGAAVATPPGSLNVSGGTTIDQLALLAANAATLQAACP